MPEYNGNAIYDYIIDNDLDYFFCVENEWILVYGNVQSIPRLIVYVSKVSDINSSLSVDENTSINRSYNLANNLNLPFVCVRFMANSEVVLVWQSGTTAWQRMTYDQLRDLYEFYGVVSPGTPKKCVNQYVSSPYHDWQRQNLGSITVSDFDLIRYRDGEIEEIIELKRSKKRLQEWVPYTNDYPNFALLINAIVCSKRDISFILYYNLMQNGPAGRRIEDISQIKVFDFVVPDKQIRSHQVRYDYHGIYTLTDLLN